MLGFKVLGWINYFSNHFFKVPEVPKKPVPEKKVPVPAPKKVEAPPAKGTSLHHVKSLGGKKKKPYIYICMHACSVTLGMSDSLRPHRLKPARLLCPWGFSWQEYWSGLSCPTPGYLPNPGSNLVSCIAGEFFTICHWGSPTFIYIRI